MQISQQMDLLTPKETKTSMVGLSVSNIKKYWQNILLVYSKNSVSIFQHQHHRWWNTIIGNFLVGVFYTVDIGKIIMWMFSFSFGIVCYLFLHVTTKSIWRRFWKPSKNNCLLPEIQGNCINNDASPLPVYISFLIGCSPFNCVYNSTKRDKNKHGKSIGLIKD